MLFNNLKITFYYSFVVKCSMFHNFNSIWIFKNDTSIMWSLLIGFSLDSLQCCQDQRKWSTRFLTGTRTTNIRTSEFPTNHVIEFKKNYIRIIFFIPKQLQNSKSKYLA